MSRVQESFIENEKNLIFHRVMSNFRNEVAARLRILPDVLGMRAGELAELVGISPPKWSNYTSPNASDLIPVYNTRELVRVFGITTDWIYWDNLASIADTGLRNKLQRAQMAPAPPLKKRKPYTRRKKLKPRVA